MSYQIFNEDCLEGMKRIESGSVDDGDALYIRSLAASFRLCYNPPGIV